MAFQSCQRFNFFAKSIMTAIYNKCDSQFSLTEFSQSYRFTTSILRRRGPLVGLGNPRVKNSYTLGRQEEVQSAIHHVAESETSMHWCGKTGSFFALNLVLFPNGSKDSAKDVKPGLSAGFTVTMGGWLAVAALESLWQPVRPNRANNNEKQASYLSLTQRQMWLLIWQVL